MIIRSSDSKVSTENITEQLNRCAQAHLFPFTLVEIHSFETPINRRFSFSELNKLIIVANAYFGVNDEVHQVNIKTGPTGLISTLDVSVDSYEIPNSDNIIKIKNVSSVIAFYDSVNNIIYLPYSIEHLDGYETQQLFSIVLSSFFEGYLERKNEESNWAANKSNIKDEVTRLLSSNDNRQIEYCESNLRRVNAEVTDHKRILQRRFNERNELMEKLALYKNPDRKRFESFFEGLDMISNHPGVEKVLIESNKVVALVNDIHCYAVVDGEERRFYIGDVKIEMDFEHTGVHFFNLDNSRRSYWTSADPHPHVDGTSGEPCLGSVEQTIVELSSQKEIYPLFLVCLDFLENANTDDVAGSNITNWDEVDEAGNIIKLGAGDINKYCENCDDYHSGDHYTISTRYEGTFFDVGISQEWCSDCAASYSTWISAANAHVSDHIVEDVLAYYTAHEDESS